MAGVSRAEDQAHLTRGIPEEDFLDMHHGDDVVAGIAQGDPILAGGQVGLVDGQGDRDGE